MPSRPHQCLGSAGFLLLAADDISLATTLEHSPGHRLKPTLPDRTGVSAECKILKTFPQESWFPPLLHEQLVLVCGQAWGKARGLQAAHTFK